MSNKSHDTDVWLSKNTAKSHSSNQNSKVTKRAETIYLVDEISPPKRHKSDNTASSNKKPNIESINLVEDDDILGFTEMAPYYVKPASSQPSKKEREITESKGIGIHAFILNFI
jgi:hypothetical protein